MLFLQQKLEVHLVESLDVVLLELLHELVDESLVLYFGVFFVLTSTSIKKLIIISESLKKVRFIKCTYF